MTTSSLVDRLVGLMPVMGVTRLAEMTGLDRAGVPVWTAMRPNAASISVNSGKGLTDERAKVGALMEAWERHVAETGLEEVVRGSARTLGRRHRLVQINGIAAFLDRPFDRDRLIGWCEGTDLIGGGTLLVPLDLVTNDYTSPPEQAGFWRRSDGLAAHSERRAAILAGLLEVIEREAHAVWTTLDSRARAMLRIDHESFADVRLACLIRDLEARDFELTLWAATPRAPIPAIIARLRDRRGAATAPFGPTIGAAAAGTWAEAAVDAILEAAQSRMGFIAGIREDIEPDDYGRGRRLEMAALGEMAIGRLVPALPASGLEDLEPDRDRLLDRILSLVAATDVEQIIVVDLARREAEPFVVRVIVPGATCSPRNMLLVPPAPRSRRETGP